MQVEHELKCHPKNFLRLCNGSKTFEIRKNDRNFQTGDRLIIREYDPEEGWPSHGQVDSVVADITYMTDFEQKDGYVVLGLNIIEINA
jgi:hypothetical protein